MTSSQKATSSLVVLTRNAGEMWSPWLAALKSQTLQLEKCLSIDTESIDGTPELSRECGLDVVSVPAPKFDHGGTRQLGLELAGNSDFVFFLTQDAILSSPDSLEQLLSFAQNNNLGGAFGRQLPNDRAGTLEAHARLFNYPSQSYIVEPKVARDQGIRAVFFSDSFSLYSSAALREVGGFPKRIIMNEDVFVAAELLRANYRIGYCAESSVQHSHAYSLWQQIRRYFDIGVFHGMHPWIREEFGNAGGEGLLYAFSELRYVGLHAPLDFLRSSVHSMGKYLAYKLGLRYAVLPKRICRMLSSNKNFWIQ